MCVSGQGSISVAPDLATLEYGVETRAANVSEANRPGIGGDGRH